MACVYEKSGLIECYWAEEQQTGALEEFWML